ncbi:MAG: ribosome small subunit-dependent GTPase A [Dietzia sp.]|uniref:Ribosome small subunit-dependent GTPase A n=2 Tax=Dietzia cercidiphylli TaxID=498199 RepID=A0ABN2II98_9ACTN|nr:MULTISPECIES: ribosome small subunit-dependent GTPase A [Dietzia]MBB1033379.1 ribosome small subunit-dependent GTPase A [Dietzia sp. CQ4]MBB1037726.1 ribosome small subunit-dependent GTPase A [Dietzia natronolimnaea]MBB1040601.1 ribosome small subunit-dependent GTPase A [Dietzia sp. Cai40]MBB1045946.1 ribosome small subunit-dependent GTPase A [Dietzia sp. DQ11-44]MBB1050475.1 ribosome small subunit-dependent GTPase A [Dietzia sp. CW19]
MATRRGGSGARGWDESDIRIRPGKGSRPRTKRRPSHSDAASAMVVSVDRGRWGCVLLDDGPDHVAGTRIVTMRARELGRTPIVVGDHVGVVGDLTGTRDTLSRIVRVEERSTVLRRTADDSDPYERVVVANAELLLIVVAVADPPPRAGFVARALVAAYTGGLDPVLCLTKGDLDDPSVFAAEFEALDVPVLRTGIDDDLTALHERIDGRISAMIGHSGVGKSTLVNRLIPDAHRATGVVSGVGKGRHTSTQSVALELGTGGWVVDTPGIRSFGLAHVSPDDVVASFSDLDAIVQDCPRGCTHQGPPADPECRFDAIADPAVHRRALAVRELLGVLQSNDAWALGTDQD